jgi:predicted dinucleotide-binding enzyme
MNTTTKVAIIGLGNIGKAVASDLTKGNYPVILASRELSQAQELSSHLGASTTPMEIAEAIKEADVIIPTIYYDKIKEFLKTYAQELQGKIIIDVSNLLLLMRMVDLKRLSVKTNLPEKSFRAITTQ